jgi:hypothetical protein
MFPVCTLISWLRIVGNQETHYCIPDDLSAGAMELAVKLAIGQDLMVFPKDRDLEASGFVGAALIKAFPCSKAKPNPRQ